MKIIIHNEVAQSIALLTDQCQKIAKGQGLSLYGDAAYQKLSIHWRRFPGFQIGDLFIGLDCEEQPSPGLRVKPWVDPYRGNPRDIRACILFRNQLAGQIPDQDVSLCPMNHPGRRILVALEEELGKGSIPVEPDNRRAWLRCRDIARTLGLRVKGKVSKSQFLLTTRWGRVIGKICVSSDDQITIVPAVRERYCGEPKDILVCARFANELEVLLPDQEVVVYLDNHPGLPSLGLVKTVLGEDRIIFEPDQAKKKEDANPM